MARNAGIAISSSRFACLKIEDDEDADKQTKSKTAAQQSSSNASKKKNKKKKDQKDNEQLKQLAFGGGKNSSSKGLSHKQSAGDGGDQKGSWDQWKQHDKEETSKQKQRIEAGLEPPLSREGRKKKKQKEKPQAMSLEQFNQLPPEKPVNGSDDSEGEENGKESESDVQTRVPATQQDPRFFNSVDDDAEQILRQEKMQEEYRKHFSSDNVIVAKLKNDLERKDLKVKELTEKMNAMEAELKQVKKRNKQLCVILAQGEMKDKAQVLLQVDELTVVRDELTEQVTSLTGELEKEKSKNHSLKGELDKLKNNKQGK
ncbi:G kinase-anchoring protein 1 isoform X2 [Aplysia californica]|uniref:G kinase-anchoring protein 1 isoform X2 n=1 Tax=Aplysia californica TaxID=6500 RepID=A0ABM0K1L5_APLCA|nr:G kinase-anchoring protein 1 isoform X2 [Aplysia californica]